MVGRPGHLRAVPRIEWERVRGDEPVYCLIGKAAVYASYDTQYFRDIRLLTRERPGPEDCDVLLKIHVPGRGFAMNTVQALSAYDGSLIWEGASTGQTFGIRSAFGFQILIPHMLRDLRSGQPAFEKIAAGRDSGKRLDADAVEALASFVPEDSIDARRMDSLRFGKLRPSQQAAAAPAPSPSRLSDVDQPPPVGARRRGHAVIIGIERYRQQLPKADYAASDAGVMAKYAATALGYPEENIALLTNDSATKGDFEKYFDRWLPNRVEKDDEVFVYFSGHGSPNPKNGDAYLVPFDGDPTYLDETGFPLKRLYAALAKLPAKKIIVTLDSCFSGAGGRSILSKGARPLVLKRAETAPAGITVLSASASEQISNTYDEQGHGLFTYFLLKGLKERGADLRSAFDYAKPQVSKMARRQYNADQEPQWREGSAQ